MILVTGDTHWGVDHHKLYTLDKILREDTSLNEPIYVVVTGDCGALWDNNYHDLKAKRDIDNFCFTTLFVDGNHENFDLLDKYPVEEWNGGKVHRISSKLIHLMRSQVFEIEGNTILTLGGALSQDKAYRTKGISWWPQEDISEEDVYNLLKVLENHSYRVDYIITHDCSTNNLHHISQHPVFNSELKPDKNTDILQKYVEEMVQECKGWYFGHYHIDKLIELVELTDEDINRCPVKRFYQCMYTNILELGKSTNDQEVVCYKDKQIRYK